VSCSPARGLFKSVKICGRKFISFEKVGFSRFSPPRHISPVAAADLDEIFAQCSDVDEVEKLGVHKFGGQGRVPPSKNFFSRKCVFFEWAFVKRIFRKKIFLGGGGQPHPQFFLFLENSLFGRKCFPLRSDVFFERKISLFFKSGGFPVFAPIAISPPFLNFNPQNFWVMYACPRAFQKCQNMWTKVHHFRESGFFSILPPSRYLSRLKADGHRSMDVRRTHGPLFISSKSLCLAIHCQPLEGATGISLYLDISAVFKILPSFCSFLYSF